jgi:excisionase family DNA binding protein
MTKRIINLKPGETVEIRMAETPSEDYFTIKEVAAKVGLNYYTVHSHIKQGFLTVEKIGRSNRVSKENLETYLKSRK